MIPSPSVAAGTLSPRSSPGGMHLNATKSLVSAVQELKAAASAIKELNAVTEKTSPTTTTGGLTKASKMAEGGDDGLGAAKKSLAGSVAKFAQDATIAKRSTGSVAKVASGAALEATDVKKSPTGSVAIIVKDTATHGSPKKSPTSATLASEIAKTLSVTAAAREAAVPSKALLSAVGATPLAPVPSLAAGTIQPRPSVISNVTSEMLSRRKSSSTASSASSETRRKKKAENVEKKKSKDAEPVTQASVRVPAAAAAGSKNALNADITAGSKANIPATEPVVAGFKSPLDLQISTPGSKSDLPATGSVVAGSKVAVSSKQNLLTATAGSEANIPATGSVVAGSKALLGSKQILETAVLGSKANIPAATSVIAGSKQALQAAIPGSERNLPAAESVVAGSKAMVSKQNRQAAAEQETEPEVELTSSPLTTEVRPLPDYEDINTPQAPPPPPPPLTATGHL